MKNNQTLQQSAAPIKYAECMDSETWQAALQLHCKAASQISE